MSEARDWPAPGFEVGALASFILKPIEKKPHGAEEYILLGAHTAPRSISSSAGSQLSYCCNVAA